MLKTVIIDARKCSGCRSCETYCSLKHEKECAPSRGRIRVIRREQEGVFVPVSCMRCPEPSCQLACQRRATYRNFATGAMEVDANLCIGCMSCIAACPFGATFLDRATGKILKCDLCDGDPICVKVCPTGALRCEEIAEQTCLNLIGGAEQFAAVC